MKVTFNSLGQIVGGIDYEGQTIRQGSTEIVLKAVFQDKLNINYNAKFNLTRSDGTNITNVTMNLGVDSNSYIFALNDEWYFAKSGQTTLTVFLVDGNGTQIATGQVQFNVQANDYDEEPETITEEQYNALLAQLNGKASVSQVVLGFSDMPTSTELQSVQVGQIFAVVNGERKLYKVVEVSGTKVADEIFDFSKYPDFTKQEIVDLVEELEENLQQQITDNKNDADANFSDINDKIPSQASASNKLVDRDTMNSSITQSASFFRGSYSSRYTLFHLDWQTDDPEVSLYVSNNDYAIVESDEEHNGETWRYKCVVDHRGYEWIAEYKVNNSAFTSDQEKAINSGITTEKRVGYDGLESRKQNKVLYGADKFDQAEDGDIIVVETTENNSTIGAGQGIEFQEINGVNYIKNGIHLHNIEIGISNEYLGNHPDFPYEKINLALQSFSNVECNTIADLFSMSRLSTMPMIIRVKSYQDSETYKALLLGIEMNLQQTKIMRLAKFDDTSIEEENIIKVTDGMTSYMFDNVD